MSFPSLPGTLANPFELTQSVPTMVYPMEPVAESRQNSRNVFANIHDSGGLAVCQPALRTARIFS
jgi:hypothetical protein